MDSASRYGRTLLLGVLSVTMAISAGGCARRRRPPAAGDAALATIGGRLVSAADLPIGTATIILEADEAEASPASTISSSSTSPPAGDRVPYATMRVSPQGTFQIPHVPAGRYLLRAHAARHADGRLRLDVRAGESVETVIRLARAETLTGQVLDGRGQPVPGARVLSWSLDDPIGRPFEASTDRHGQFAFSALARGMHRLIADAPGLGPIEVGPIEVPSAAASGLVMKMTAAGQSVVGSVIAAGRPVGGARVLIGGENLTPSRETLSGADGRFAFAGLGPGVYALRAAGQDQVSRTSAEVVVEPSGDRVPPVRLELGPGWTMAGRVVDDAGRALPDAEVRIDALPGEDPLPELVRADRRGGWRSGPLPAGEYRLTPRRPGFVARRPVQLLLGARAATADRPQLLELVRGAEIDGRVVDQRGAPVRDALVRCVMPGREDLSVIGDRLPLAAEAAGLPSGSGHALGRARSVITDSSGRFQLPDMLPGRFFLDVSREARVPQRSAPLQLVPGQRLDVGTIDLVDGVRVTGRVVDENDSAIEGARITVGNGGPGTVKAGRQDIVLETDRAGQFASALAEGVHTLIVSAAGMRSQSVIVRALAASPPAALTVRLSRADAVFDGLVRDTAGRPVARARVVAWPAPADAASDGELPAIPDAAVPLSGAITDTGGHFQLARLPAGRFVLEVKHPDYPRAAQIVEAAATPGAPAIVELALPGGIEGEVREQVTGAVITSYRVEARGPQERIASPARKNGSGFVLSALLPGRWSLSVHAPGYRPSDQAVEVAASSGLGEPSVRGLRIELEPEPRR
jgi:protocatechuate 3,4-dioxygenase beta subunit